MHVTFSRVRDDGDARRFDVVVNGIPLGECQRYYECDEWCCDYSIERMASMLAMVEHGYIHGHTHARSLQAALRRTLKRGTVELAEECRNS